MDTLESGFTRLTNKDNLPQRTVVVPFDAIEKIIDHTAEILSITEPSTRFSTIMKLTGLSFNQLAQETNFAVNSIVNLYYKCNDISAKNIIYIAHYLGLPVELFVNGLDLGQGPTTLINPINAVSTEFIIGHRIFRERIAMLKEYTNTSDMDLRRAQFDFTYLKKRAYVYRIPNLKKLGVLSKLFNVPISLLIKGVEFQLALD